MDDLSTITTETTEPLLAAPAVDLEQARTEVARTKAALVVQEQAIAAGELAEAEQKHAPLLEQCRTLQEKFDALNSQVDAQRHVYFKAIDRRNGANAALDMERRNRPNPDWQGGRAYRVSANTEWEARIAACVAEQRAADAAFAPVSAEMIRLQGERRAASKELETASWEADSARQSVLGFRKKLEKMKPRSAAIPPWQEQPVPENLIVVVGNY
jgi:chromosome segregation ATPase